MNIGISEGVIFRHFSSLHLPRRTPHELAALAHRTRGIKPLGIHWGNLTFKDSNEERFAAPSSLPSTEASLAEERGFVSAALQQLAIQDSFSHDLLRRHFEDGVSLQQLELLWDIPAAELTLQLQSALKKLRAIITSL